MLLSELREFGKQRAWSGLVAHFRAPLLRLGGRMGLPPADAEDAVPETLLVFARSYRDGSYQRGKGRLKDWLYGIAEHKFLETRRKRRNAAPARAQAADLSWSSLPAAEPSREWWEDEWRRAVIERCLA